MITRDNYEITFINFLDGNLSVDQENELHAFLKQNDDLKKELDNVKEMMITADDVKYKNKASLKRSYLEDEDAFDDACIAFMEGDLTEYQNNEFVNFIEKNVDKRIIFNTYQQTKLQANKTIVFPHKKKLYKRVVLWRNFSHYLSTAAAVVMALLLVRFIDIKWTNVPPQYAASQLSYSSNYRPAINEVSQTTTALPPQTTNSKMPNSDMANVSINNETSAPIATPPSDITQQIIERGSLLEPVTAKKHSLSRQYFIYKPQLAVINTTIKKAPANKSAIQAINSAGQRLLTNNSTGNLKTIPSSEIKRGLYGILKKATNSKLNIETNDDGKAKKINLNGNLLAFSLPLSKN